MNIFLNRKVTSVLSAAAFVCLGCRARRPRLSDHANELLQNIRFTREVWKKEKTNVASGWGDFEYGDTIRSPG